MKQLTYSGQLDLDELAEHISGDEDAGFRLKALDHDATLTMADYKAGRRPKKPVVLQEKGNGWELPDGHTLICEGKVLKEGKSTEVAAIRESST